MCKIKFRGKSVETNEWVYGYYGVKGEGTDLEKHCIMVSTLQTNAIIPFFYFTDIEVISETVGQFIGLTDKNGNDIFDEDLLRLKCLGWEYALVKFHNGVFGFYVNENDRLLSNVPEYWEDSEIIGNIHDKYVLYNGA